MIELIETKLEGLKRLKNKCFHDERGYSMETFSRKTLDLSFCQDNVSFSKKAGTIRGLHFQIAPFAQAKLVTVLQGSILDVAVDLRKSSESYGQYVVVELSQTNQEQLYVPVGFAHGFITLEPETLVTYKVSAFYSKEHDRGVLWCDEDLGIPWPQDHFPPTLSEKDQLLPRFKDLEDYFL